MLLAANRKPIEFSWKLVLDSYLFKSQVNEGKWGLNMYCTAFSY